MFSLVLIGCSKPCPKHYYPNLIAVDKVKKTKVSFNGDGSLDTEPAQLLRKQNKKLRVNEAYTWDLLFEYRRVYILKDLK